MLEKESIRKLYVLGEHCEPRDLPDFYVIKEWLPQRAFVKLNSGHASFVLTATEGYREADTHETLITFAKQFDKYPMSYVTLWHNKELHIQVLSDTDWKEEQRITKYSQEYQAELRAEKNIVKEEEKPKKRGRKPKS